MLAKKGMVEKKVPSFKHPKKANNEAVMTHRDWTVHQI
jgi:hypothetical protein